MALVPEDFRNDFHITPTRDNRKGTNMRELNTIEIEDVSGAGTVACFPCPTLDVFLDDVIIICPPPPHPFPIDAAI